MSTNLTIASGFLGGGFEIGLAASLYPSEATLWDGREMLVIPKTLPWIIGERVLGPIVKKVSDLWNLLPSLPPPFSLPVAAAVDPITLADATVQVATAVEPIIVTIANAAVHTIVSNLITNAMAGSGRSITLTNYLSMIATEFSEITENIVRHGLLAVELRQVKVESELICTNLEKYRLDLSKREYLKQAETAADNMHAKWITILPTIVDSKFVKVEVQELALRLLRTIATQDILVQASCGHESIAQARAKEYLGHVQQFIKYFEPLIQPVPPAPLSAPGQLIISTDFELPKSRSYLIKIGYLTIGKGIALKYDESDHSLKRFESFLQECAGVPLKPCLDTSTPKYEGRKVTVAQPGTLLLDYNYD